MYIIICSGLFLADVIAEDLSWEEARNKIRQLREEFPTRKFTIYQEIKENDLED